MKPIKTKSSYDYRKKLYEYTVVDSTEEQLKPHQLIGHRIRNVVNELKNIDRILDHALRIKQESNTTTDDYWIRTKRSLIKLEGMLNGIKNKLKNIRS
jgi:hypothetical protein